MRKVKEICAGCFALTAAIALMFFIEQVLYMYITSIVFRVMQIVGHVLLAYGVWKSRPKVLVCGAAMLLLQSVTQSAVISIPAILSMYFPPVYLVLEIMYICGYVGILVAALSPRWAKPAGFAGGGFFLGRIVLGILCGAYGISIAYNCIFTAIGSVLLGFIQQESVQQAASEAVVVSGEGALLDDEKLDVIQK